MLISDDAEVLDFLINHNYNKRDLPGGHVKVTVEVGTYDLANEDFWNLLGAYYSLE